MPSFARVVAAIAFVGSLLAQTPPPHGAPAWSAEQALAQLAGDEPASVAWAAHLLGEAKLREAIPSLRAALPRAAAMENGHFVRLHVLDALVQLDAELATGELLPHAVGELRVPALLLAAKDPATHRDYFAARMEALAGAEDLEWRVCGNLLAARPQPGFAAHCLRHLAFTMRVRVETGEPWNPRGGVAVPGPVSNCFGGIAIPPAPPPLPAGFPPSVGYELDRDNATCRTRAGFACIAWRRHADRSVFEVAACDAQRAWRDWLAACGDVHTAAACAETELRITHRWTGPGKLRTVVRDEQRRRERLFAAMVGELTKSGELTDAEAKGAKLMFVLDLDDRRGKPSKPLPSPAELLATER